MIHPAKEPVPFWACCYSGGLVSYLSFWLYIYMVEDAFWHAIFFGVCVAFVAVAIIAILIVKRITFE